MNFLETRILSYDQKEQIRSLWNREYPISIQLKAPKNFEDYLSKLEDHYHILVLDNNEQIIGWFFDFIRGKERWFAMIVDSNYQGKGLGSELLKRGQSRHVILNGWISDSPDHKKANGETYRLPNRFYTKNGFEIFPEVRLETPALNSIKIQWRRKKG